MTDTAAIITGFAYGFLVWMLAAGISYAIQMASGSGKD